MKSGSPQPLVIEVYEKRDRKGNFKDENRIACCSLPSSLTTGAAFARVKEFAERYEAAEVDSACIRSVKAFCDMGARVGTRYKSVPVLKKIVPDYVRAFPQGVPVESRYVGGHRGGVRQWHGSTHRGHRRYRARRP